MESLITNFKEIDLAYFKSEIKKLLKEIHFSQTQFANYMGVSKNTVSAWLNKNDNKKTQPRWLRPLFLVIQLFQNIDGFNPMQLFFPNWKDLEIEKYKDKIKRKFNENLNEQVREYKRKLKQESETIKKAYDKENEEFKKNYGKTLKKNKSLKSENESLKLKLSQIYKNPMPMTPEDEQAQDKNHPNWRKSNERLISR